VQFLFFSFQGNTHMKTFKKNFKTLVKSALGAAVGAAVYMAVSGLLVDGHVSVFPTLHAMFWFGLTFGALSASVHSSSTPSLLGCFVLGLFSVVIVGAGILAIVGFGHIAALLSANAILPTASLVGLALLLGSGGYTALRIHR
jgi:hypothetical protein